MAEDKEFKVIGTRPIRHDGIDKVTGRAAYGADIHFPDMLHGKVLRSPHAHARIKSIDISKASSHPAVKCIITSDDLPLVEDTITELGETVINLKYLSDNILASDKALYKGHPVAAIAATDPYVAEEALNMIEVDYEILEPVLDVRQAMEPDAPVLHESLKTESIGKNGDRSQNVASHSQRKNGDLEAGFAAADVIVERDFSTATVHQGYIETHNATAQYNEDGELTVWCSTQGAFGVRDQLSKILKMPVSKIKVVPMEIGGGFGGKVQVYIKPIAALLAMRTRKPVKMTMTRTEVFEGTGPAPGSYIRVKLGADKTGKITAAEAHLVFEAGAYPGSAVGAGSLCIFAPYKIENLQIDGYDVVLNKPKSSAYRAPGAPNACFASECVIDEICQKLNMDPIEFRLINGVKEGDRRCDGPIYPKIGYLETVEAAQEHHHYAESIDQTSNGKLRGRGVASGFWMNGGGRSSVTINVNSDGRINLIEGSTDIGGTRASIAMQAAEVLGLSAEDIMPVVGDTDSVGYTGVTGGSRTTFATGIAAINAAEDIRAQMIGVAANHWEIRPSDVKFKDGTFLAQKNGEALQMTFKEVAAAAGGPLVGAVTASPGGAGNGFATHIVDLEVDSETGKVDILRYTAIQDVGLAIHPSYAEGQVEGGVAQGVGWALSEGYLYNDEGHMTNASFLDYRMPTSYDLPSIETVLVEVPNPGHPYGVRGAGEVPLVPPLAAIANAVSRAIGIRMTELPMSPDRVLEAMGSI